jgi:anti-anti-sigma factor
MIYSSSLVTTPDGRCVFLTGEVDASVSGHVSDVLSDALTRTHGLVEVNLRGLQLLDCAGIVALLKARAEARRRGRVLFVSEPRGIVRRVLDITGTLTVLTTNVAVGFMPSPVDDPYFLEWTEVL